MSKVILAFSLVAFWLLLPVGLMIAGVGGFNEITTDDIHQADEPGILTLLLDIGKLVSTYFKLMFFIIPDANFIVLRFVNFLQLMSALIVLLIVRGS